MNPRYLFVLAALASTGAAAQSGCMTVDGQLICPRPRTGNQMEDHVNDISFRTEVDIAQQRQQQREKRQQQAAVAEQALKESVGRLIADGNCPAAYGTALRAGDLELASQVKEICSSEH